MDVCGDIESLGTSAGLFSIGATMAVPERDVLRHESRSREALSANMKWGIVQQVDEGGFKRQKKDLLQKSSRLNDWNVFEKDCSKMVEHKLRSCNTDGKGYIG